MSEEDFDVIVDGFGKCKKVYLELDECLDKNKRSWIICKNETKKFKKCYDSYLKNGKDSEQQKLKILSDLIDKKNKK
jgi:hypothetical protein